MVKLTEKSKLIAYYLRHCADMIDNRGYCSIDVLIEKVKETYSDFNQDELEEIVNTDNKQRYSFDITKEYVRANQGHSIPVDLDLEEYIPTNILYHGTTMEAYNSIIESGFIKPMNRQYSHFSLDKDTAIKVSKRRKGKHIVLKINAIQAYYDGIVFYKSVNNVILSGEVPEKYIMGYWQNFEEE